MSDRPRGQIRVRVLGQFSVERDGKTLPDAVWERPSARTLFKLLAIEPSHRLHREQILELLWPDQPPDSAAQTLRQALTRTRNALEPERTRWGLSRYLHVDREMVALEVSEISIDLDCFESAAKAALMTGEPEALAAALELYTGELLPKDRYAEWAAGRRQDVEHLRERLLLAHAQACEARGRYQDAIERLRTALEPDLTREAIHREIMRLYLAAGNPQRAIDQFERLRRALEEELGEPPEPATIALFDAGVARLEEMAARKAPAATLLPPAAARHLPDIPLLGREHMMIHLRDVLTQLMDGTGRALLISGEAGVGKTRLVAELAREAAEAGATVLWGQCYQQGGVVAYAPMVGAVEGYLASHATVHVDELAARYPELAALLPSLGRTEGPPAARPQPNPSVALTEQARLFAAFARLLAELDGGGSLVLVLDDLHAADAASVELLNHLLHLAPEGPARVLATYRREDVPRGSFLHRILVATQQDGLARTVGLLRLSREDADRLVAALLPGVEAAPVLADRIWELSLGNPLFTRELVQTMQSRHILGVIDGRWELTETAEVTIPHTLRDIVSVRVDHFGPDVAEVLNLAAVHGMEIDYRLLRRAAALDDKRLLDAVDAALEGRILEERAEHYTFRHPLLRQALLESLSTARRMYLHGRLAEAIERERPDDVEMLAHHFDHSGEDEKAVEYLERAGDRAKGVYAHADAEALYRRVLARLDGMARSRDAARVREKLGTVLVTQARYDEALAVFDQALAVQQAADSWERVGELAGHICYVHSVVGSLSEGMRRIGEFLDLLRDKDTPAVAVRLRIARANILFDLGSYEESAAEAGRAVEEASATGDRQAQALAGVAHGLAVASTGRMEEGGGILERAVALARAIDDPDSLSLGLFMIGTATFLSGLAAVALPVFEETVTVAERLGDPVRMALAVTYRGVAEFILGRWDDALADYTRGLEQMRSIRSHYSPFPLFYSAGLYLARGDWAKAESHSREALAVGGESNVLCVRLAQRVLAELDILRGRPEEAIARLEPLLDRPGTEEQGVTDFLATLAWAHLEAGNTAHAGEVAREAVRRSRAAFTGYLPSALRVLGMIQTAERQYQAAAVTLDEAIAAAQHIQCPYDEARALRARADLAVAEGEPANAASLLEGAVAIFHRLGAQPALQQAATTLAGLQQSA